MDPTQEHRSRVIPPTDSAVHKDQRPRPQQRGIRPHGRDTPDGAGAGDEGGRERILTLTVVDLTGIGDYICGEDADDSATGAGFRRWERLDGERGGRGC